MGQRLKIRNNWVGCQYYLQKFGNNIKWDLCLLKVLVWSLDGLSRRWGRGQNETFSKYMYGQIAYQIEGNDAYNNMVANILRADTPSAPGLGSKCQSSFSPESSYVAYQFKGNGA